jgi:hypothetical protein
MLPKYIDQNITPRAQNTIILLFIQFNLIAILHDYLNSI